MSVSTAHREPDLRCASFQLAEALAKRYARLNRPVVLVGPVGSGKSTLARRVHGLSRRSGAMVTVSAGELTEQLYADVLFGHLAGAFTGAQRERRGAFQLAANGTLLLDDVTFMRTEVQAAILRAVEDRSFRPLGASRDIVVTSREVYAMTRHPDVLADQNVLLPDLKSRLGEFVIVLPSLRERRPDIPWLAEEYVQEFAREHGLGSAPSLSDAVVSILAVYPWPGNLRELRAVAERATVHAMSDGNSQIIPQHLPARFSERHAAGSPRRLDSDLVRFALAAAGGNKTKAARALGVHRNTIHRYTPTGTV